MKLPATEVTSVNVDVKVGWVIDLGRSSLPLKPGDVIIAGEAVELPASAASDE